MVNTTMEEYAEEQVSTLSNPGTIPSQKSWARPEPIAEGSIYVMSFQIWWYLARIVWDNTQKTHANQNPWMEPSSHILD